MPMGMIFWMLMILWAVFGVGAYYPPVDGPYRRPALIGFNLLLFVLLALLGLKVFGSAVTS